MTLYDRLLQYLEDNPCHDRMQIAEALGTSPDYLHRLLLRGQREGEIRAEKEGTFPGWRFVYSRGPGRHIPSRYLRALQRAGVKNAAQMRSLTPRELIAMRGVGVDGARHILRALQNTKG